VIGIGTVRGGFLRRPGLEVQLIATGVEPGARVYTRGDLTVIIGRHPDTGRLHLSVSAPDRDPSWQELKDARYTLLPRPVWFAQMMPPPDHYINLHAHTFHLYQLDPPVEIA
jgi:hypothetical protein